MSQSEIILKSNKHFKALNDERKIMSPKLIELHYSRQADLIQPIRNHLDRNSDLFITYVALRVYLISLGTRIIDLSTDNQHCWRIEFEINGAEGTYEISHDVCDGYRFKEQYVKAKGQMFAKFSHLIQAIMQTKELFTAQQH